jgi:hypothetical protein
LIFRADRLVVCRHCGLHCKREERAAHEAVCDYRNRWTILRTMIRNMLTSDPRRKNEPILGDHAFWIIIGVLTILALLLPT